MEKEEKASELLHVAVLRKTNKDVPTINIKLETYVNLNALPKDLQERILKEPRIAKLYEEFEEVDNEKDKD